jgi:hypothetical protein
MSLQIRQRSLCMACIANLAALLLLALAAGTTTLAHLSFEELAQKATAIARLRCLGVVSKWENNEIWTDTRFAVIEQNKGTLNATITVRMLGGSVGNIHSHVDGVPTFRPGEEVYVFLWAQGSESLRVLGWSQGTFRISRDARTGVEKVTQDVTETAVYQPETRQFVHAGIRGLPVVDFRQKLKQVLAAEAR